MSQRIAFITGGMGDIGTALCHEFINQNITVVVGDSAPPEKAAAWLKKQRALGYDIHAVHLDVLSFESCQSAAKEIENQFKQVDILVNAAGTLKDVTLRNMTLEQWESVVHSDLDSVFNVTRQFINGMIEKKYGRIITISSVNAEKGQFGQTNYASAKAGIYGFTKSLAQEVAKYGITVNAISPGFVESHMVNTIPADIRQKLIETIPLQRLAKPEEIAWAIAFLASEKSGYITGTNLSINGGIHM